MKIFEYDPITQKRGEILREVKRASWFEASLTFALSKGIYDPVPFKGIMSPPEWANCEVTIHTDGGIERYIEGNTVEFASYRDPDKWVAMCTGQYTDGQNDWVWSILPPTSLLRSL